MYFIVQNSRSLKDAFDLKYVTCKITQNTAVTPSLPHSEKIASSIHM